VGTYLPLPYARTLWSLGEFPYAPPTLGLCVLSCLVGVFFAGFQYFFCFAQVTVHAKIHVWTPNPPVELNVKVLLLVGTIPIEGV
jgi:RsiW-degrading membrane proteinase PrsW (M82 family)